MNVYVDVGHNAEKQRSYDTEQPELVAKKLTADGVENGYSSNPPEMDGECAHHFFMCFGSSGNRVSLPEQVFFSQHSAN